MRRFFLWFWWLIFALFIVGRIVAYTTEAWWYSEQGHLGIYVSILSTRLVLFALGATLVSVVLGANLRFAWRAEMRRRQKLTQELQAQIYTVFDAPPDDITDTPQNLGLVRLRRWAWRLGLGFFAFVGGAFASFNWPLWLHARNAVPSGKYDPIFGLDAGFYLFHLPALQFVWMFVFLLLCITLIGVFLVYGHDNDFDLRGEMPTFSAHALKHLSLLLAAIFFWKAIGYRLDSYELLTTQQASVAGEAFTGIGYTDARVRLQLLLVMSVAALLAAAVVWWAGQRNELRHGVWTTGIYLAVSAVLLVFLPGFVQALRVDPQGARLQVPYLEHHLAWTRWAYNLDNIIKPGAEDTRSEKQSSAQNTFPHIRKPAELSQAVSLWNESELLERLYRVTESEFSVANATFGMRKVGSKWRPVYFVPRERSPMTVRQNVSTRIPDAAPVVFENRNEQKELEGSAWLNRHFRWTHGSGVLICDANRLQRDIPSTPTRPSNVANSLNESVDLPLTYSLLPGELTHPQIYFGEWQAPSREQVISRLAQEENRDGRDSLGQASSHSAAPNALPTDGVSGNAMPGTARRIGGTQPLLEWQTLFNPDADYVVLQPNTEAARAAGLPSFEYSPEAGVPVGNRWRRFLLAWRFADPRFYLSSLIDESSRVVWHRRISDRCAALAPLVDWQSTEPRAVIYNGRIVWLIQGITSSRYAPYSQVARDGTNYSRASVVATVDAFTGETQFFITDSTDVLLRSYARAFPGLFQQWNELPDELQQQLTYSQSALEKQASIWLHLRQMELPRDKASRKSMDETTRWEQGGAFYAALPVAGGKDNAAKEQKVTSGVFFNAVDEDVPQACLMATRNAGGKEQLWLWSSKQKTKTPEQGAANALYLPGVSHWVQIHVEQEGEGTMAQNDSPRRFVGVLLNWNGKTARAANLEDAVQLLDARMRQPASRAKKLSPEQQWQQARQLAQMMRRARQGRDWATYGTAEKQLMELLNPTSSQR